MQFIPVKTSALLPPKDDIFGILDQYLHRLKEGDVIFITSKVLAIHQGRCIKISGNIDKDALILQEAEAYVPYNQTIDRSFLLTIKEHTLIPSAGIDESNGNGYYILWPKNPAALAKNICLYLKKKTGIKRLAVIVTDSHTTPLRLGVTGISTGFYGLEPLIDLRGKQDIFGRKLKYTKVNVVDALAAMAVLLMGESAEQTPIVIARKALFVKFTERKTYKKLGITAKKDIYWPLLKAFKRKSAK